ncbi:MAG: class I SAM-dependent methyltransferase [Verrucomicrobiales bacterium]|nr:class I SAM-dependent methyltransferase [Verrucomicrobiales bacterium]
MNTGDLRIFTDTWSLYDRVLLGNYMFHEEIFRVVGDLLSTRCRPGEFRILDLGCGNARHLASILIGRPPALYAGYDLSASALCQARSQLDALPCPSDLRQADFRDAFHTLANPFGVIFSSFAVHHLSFDQKQQFFLDARNLLAPGGFLLLVDTSREADEDREAYLRNYCQWVHADWSALSAGDLAAIEDHIRKRDFPETSAAIQTMAASAGFRRSAVVARYRWHRTWLLE